MSKEILNDLQNTFSELKDLISSLDDKKLNTIPFEGSWTAAQVSDHIIRSINGMSEALGMPGKTTDRNAEEKISELKNMFMNFDSKMKSPPFILPTKDIYEKSELLDNLKNAGKKIIDTGKEINFSELLDLKPLGELTKIEVLYFILYHTQRHIHQFKNIADKTMNN